MTAGNVFPSCLNHFSSFLPLLLEATPDHWPTLPMGIQWTFAASYWLTCVFKSNLFYKKVTLTTFLLFRKKKKKDNHYVKFKSTAITKLIRVITSFEYNQLPFQCIIIQCIFLCLYVCIYTHIENMLLSNLLLVENVSEVSFSIINMLLQKTLVLASSCFSRPLPCYMCASFASSIT